MTVAEMMDAYVADMDAGKLGKKPPPSPATRAALHRRSSRSWEHCARLPSPAPPSKTSPAPCRQHRPVEVVSLTGAVFNWAQKRKLVAVNPVKGVALPKAIHKTRRLLAGEYGLLGAALKSMTQTTVADIFLALALSGWRSSEMRLLRWSEVDAERRLANFADTKSGQAFARYPPLFWVLSSARSAGRAIMFLLTATQSQFSIFNRIGESWGYLVIVRSIPFVKFCKYFSGYWLQRFDYGGILGHRMASITSRYLHIEASLITAADKVAQETLRLMKGSNVLASV